MERQAKFVREQGVSLPLIAEPIVRTPFVHRLRTEPVQGPVKPCVTFTPPTAPNAGRACAEACNVYVLMTNPSTSAELPPVHGNRHEQLRMSPGTRLLALSGATVMILASAAHAHHSFAPKYDPAKSVRVSGIAGNVHLQNPHSYFEVSSSGKTWTVETEGVAAAKAAGLTNENLKDGAKVSVTGWAARNGSAALGLHTITVGGKTLTLRRSAR